MSSAVKQERMNTKKLIHLFKMNFYILFIWNILNWILLLSELRSCNIKIKWRRRKKTKLTIIFSKRSTISFSERFMDLSSKKGCGWGSSTWVEMGSVGCWIRGFSFFVPVFLKLVIRSRWKKMTFKKWKYRNNSLFNRRKKWSRPPRIKTSSTLAGWKMSC